MIPGNYDVCGVYRYGNAHDDSKAWVNGQVVSIGNVVVLDASGDQSGNRSVTMQATMKGATFLIVGATTVRWDGRDQQQWHQVRPVVVGGKLLSQARLNYSWKHPCVALGVRPGCPAWVSGLVSGGSRGRSGGALGGAGGGRARAVACGERRRRPSIRGGAAGGGGGRGCREPRRGPRRRGTAVCLERIHGEAAVCVVVACVFKGRGGADDVVRAG